MSETNGTAKCADRLGKTMFNKIGGQAVVEGVMMRAPGRVATAVRRPDGSIVVRARPFRSVTERWRALRLPVLRGAVALIESLALGMGALLYSAEASVGEEEAGEAPGGKYRWTLWLVLALSLLLGIGFFFYLPLLLTAWTGVKGGFAFNLVDGIIRLVFLFAYIAAIGLWKDMRRVLAYHGAEHKSIYNLESGEELTAGNAARFSKLHPRCGTSFLFIVMVVSVLVFSFLGKPDSVGDRLLRFAFLPLIAGVSYEFLKLSGKWADRPWMAPLIAPGLFLQRMTTREPDDGQIEVALTALRAALGGDVGDREELLKHAG
jgi:uncharacterized protein YqhQ